MTGARYHEPVAGLSDFDNKLQDCLADVKQIVHK
jgi:hypothetical protein